MTKAVRTFVGAVGMSALGFLPVVAVLALALYPTHAEAKGGGNGNDGDRGNGGDRGNSGDRGESGEDGNSGNRGSDRNGERPSNHGAVASELKGLNAAHANPTAMENAAPTSRVGQLAAYKDAALASQEAAGNVAAATEALAAAEAALADASAAYAGRTSHEISDEIAGLDPAAPDYVDQLNALSEELAEAEDHEAAIAGLEADVVAAEAALAEVESAAASAEETEAAALLEAANGRDLTPEAIEELRELLGL
jgi:hypothetical protein